jgi:hypothetical protein
MAVVVFGLGRAVALVIASPAEHSPAHSPSDRPPSAPKKAAFHQRER